MPDSHIPSPPPQPVDAARAAALDPLRGRPLLLATDGSAESLAGVRVAAGLAASRGAVPHAVRVFDTTPIGRPAVLPRMIAAADALLGPDLHEADVEAVRAELGGVLGHPVDWPVHLGVGAPAAVIARQAAQIGAVLIVMGLRRHGPLGRVARDETTLNVMRVAACPVLGVTPALTGLPRRVVVGVDFGPASVRAARAALDILDVPGTLVLAYVGPVGRGVEVLDDAEGSLVVHALGVDAAFDRLVADLAVPARVTVERAHVAGQPKRPVEEALLGVAAEHGVDLLAVGTQSRGWIERVIFGSVTTGLARDGRYPLLVVPPIEAGGR